MRTLIFLFLLIGILEAQETISSFLLYEDRRDVKVENGHQANFLTLKEKIHKEVKRIKEFTLCYRFNFLSFGYNEMYRGASLPIWLNSDNYVDDLSQPCYHSECKTDFIYWLWTNTYSYMTFGTFPDHVKTVLQQKGKNVIFPLYKETVNPYKWHSICLGPDLGNLRVTVVHNGKTQGNYSQPKILAELDDGTDTSIVQPFTTLKPWDKDSKEWMKALENSLWSGATLAWNHAKFSGYLTDLQIFGRALSREEMYDLTSCRTFPKGDIYSWDTNDWEPYNKELQADPDLGVQYKIVDVPLKSLCMSEVKYTFFPDLTDFRGSIDLCRRFGGRMMNFSTYEQFSAVFNFLAKEIVENEKYKDITHALVYIPYTDEEEDMNFIHYETGQPPIDPLPWSNSQPNGGMVECCGHVNRIVKDDNGEYTSTLIDMPCSAVMPVLCEDVGEIVLEIRGMCKFSKIDTTFTLVEGVTNKKRFFVGRTGWRLFWDGNLWSLSSPNFEYTFGTHTEFSTYPLGKKYWSIVNDSQCVYPDSDNVEISITPCNTSAFTCDDGSCIAMNKR